MSARSSNKGLITILVASLLMGLIALPSSVKSNWPDNRFVNLFKNPKVTLGLDLQGGTQLDYRIDLRNAIAKNEDDDPNNDVAIRDVIEGVRTTLERRVNGLGVSEPQIYLSNVAGEQHIIVELAGIKDVEEAKAVVGKTIQLEFKEPKTENDPDEEAPTRAQADQVLSELKGGADFAELGNRLKTSDGKINFRESKGEFESLLSGHRQEILTKLTPGKLHPEVVDGSDGFVISAGGQLSEKTGIYIMQLVDKQVEDREVTTTWTIEDISDALGVNYDELSDKVYEDFEQEVSDILWPLEGGKWSPVIEVGDKLHLYNVFAKTNAAKEVKASHILISYAGASRADASITRQKEEAYIRAQEVVEKLNDDGSNFAKLAGEFSDGPTSTKGGDLGYFGIGAMAKPFEDAAFAAEVGDITDIVETEFGYHIIQVNDARSTEDRIGAHRFVLANTNENRTKMEDALAKTEGFPETKQETKYTYHELFFDLTPDPWKATGLDGAHFKYSTVVYNQIGTPEVSIEFDKEGGEMFEELTDRLKGQQMAIFVGGQLISAPTVNQKITGGQAVITGNFTLPQALQLANDLNTGAIDAPIILSGQYTISATLGDDALRTSLLAGLIGLAILALFMILYYRLFGLMAVIALVIYSVILMFIVKVSGQIVLTLAGVAGIILSIGMAVDANILIFERTREELKAGRNFGAAVMTGFERAWSSIRDSNVSSLITCAILYLFGNSIIRGFAIMLGLGILVSMFTAITVTRALLRSIQGTAISRNRVLLGVKVDED